MTNDFKDRKLPTPIRSPKSVSESVPPDGPAHQARPPQRSEDTNAIGEKVYASIYGWKLVAAFERLGSVAKVARCYGVRCSTVELALSARLQDCKRAA